MTLALPLLLSLPLFCSPALQEKYTIKPTDSPVPKEVTEPIRSVLGAGAIQLLDGKGNIVCEVWFRKVVSVKATPEQVANGLSYREIDESTVLGVVRFDMNSTDYRKQKIRPGVYTLRLGFQPQDGDHMGTAPHSEFCLMAPANLDQKTDLMESKELRELSAKVSGTSHPSVLLLFPNEKPEAVAKLVSKGNDTWAVAYRQSISVRGKETANGIGFALALVGHTTAE